MTAALIFLVITACLSVGFATDYTAGCGKDLGPFIAGNSTALSIVTPDGLTRTFHVYLPSSYDNESPLPVVVVFHGGGGTGSGAESRYGVDEQAEANNFVAVYPDGYDNTWNGGLCCSKYDIDDITFVSMMMDFLEANICVDTTRFFAAGMSAGAVFTYRVACDLADRFAAISPVEGTLEYFPCKPSRPMPILAFHGEWDINIPYEGGLGCNHELNRTWTSVPRSIARFMQRDFCKCSFNESMSGDSGCGAITTYPDGSQCTWMGDCTNPRGDDVNVTLCLITKNGHAWAGTPYNPHDIIKFPDCNFNVSATFEVSPLMWEFFSVQQLINISAGDEYYGLEAELYDGH